MIDLLLKVAAMCINFHLRLQKYPQVDVVGGNGERCCYFGCLCLQIYETNYTEIGNKKDYISCYI